MLGLRIGKCKEYLHWGAVRLVTPMMRVRPKRIFEVSTCSKWLLERYIVPVVLGLTPFNEEGLLVYWLFNFSWIVLEMQHVRFSAVTRRRLRVSWYEANFAASWVFALLKIPTWHGVNMTVIEIFFRNIWYLNTFLFTTWCSE